MKKINLLYWIFTALFAFIMLGSAIPDILVMPIAVTGMHDGLGYPVYLIPFVGVAKVLGVLAILLPIHARIKEWAYTGLFIDLIGATYSLIAVGSPVANYAFMALPLTLGVLSYVFYLKRSKLQAGKANSQKTVNTNFSKPVFQ